MTMAIAERLLKGGVSVELADGGLYFAPAAALTQELNEALDTNEGEELYARGLAIRDHLALIRETYDLKRWKALHSRITRYEAWPDFPDHLEEYIAYSRLATWVNAGRKVAEGGNDASFFDRNLPQFQRQLVGVALLWPFIEAKILKAGIQ